MNDEQRWRFRLSVLSTLVRRSPGKLDQSAIMFLVYLLQTAKKVPLGYRFSLYTYGPYDPTVLSDLSQAETLNAIKSSPGR